MVLTSTLTAKTALALGAVIAAGEVPSAAGGDPGSLYVAVSGVLVALISAAAVIFTSRNKTAQTQAVPFIVDDATLDELTGLYRDAEQRAARAEITAEMWKARAQQAGWGEQA